MSIRPKGIEHRWKKIVFRGKRNFSIRSSLIMVTSLCLKSFEQCGYTGASFRTSAFIGELLFRVDLSALQPVECRP